ncbi:MAG: hypothetical protein OXF89_06310 [Rhodospirillaceae bacterium]|nr:hypothetical protein [Rhodospirillaceae bacterium]MCY4064928.1 hypothetical protein [Rhodospirillaceae bacterium]
MDASTKEPEQSADMAAQQTDAVGAKRERSRIAFPYMALDEAVDVAKAIHKNVGLGECADDQLAPWLGLSPKSSGYRTRISAAKMFGLIEGVPSAAYKLADLGLRVVDSTQQSVAKSEAFLRVPLFNAVYERFRGNALPGPTGLESEFVSLGVPQKQTSKARWAFEKSAQSAGYFHKGNDRLVKPGFVEEAARPSESMKGGEETTQSRGRVGGDERHPLIEGLLATLPPKDGNWPVEERVVWLKTAATGFDLIYGIEGTIKIEGSASGTKKTAEDSQ